MLLSMCFYYIEMKKSHVSLQSLEFTPLNAKIKDLEGNPKFYTQVTLKNLD